MRALTVAQPWAALIVAGIKTIETRPAPPNGEMRPDGTRGIPGYSIRRGERIAIHAAGPAAKAGPGPWYDPLIDPDHPGRLREPLTFSAIVGTVAVVEAVPIIKPGCTRPGDYCTTTSHDGPLPHQQGGLWLFGPNAGLRHVPEQEPLGDFTPGRWAWLLDDPKPTTEQCPRCAGTGSAVVWVQGHPLYGACLVCDGRRRCEPISTRGRQGVWEWTA